MISLENYRRAVNIPLSMNEVRVRFARRENMPTELDIDGTHAIVVFFRWRAACVIAGDIDHSTQTLTFRQFQWLKWRYAYRVMTCLNMNGFIGSILQHWRKNGWAVLSDIDYSWEAAHRQDQLSQRYGNNRR